MSRGCSRRYIVLIVLAIILLGLLNSFMVVEGVSTANGKILAYVVEEPKSWYMDMVASLIVNDTTVIEGYYLFTVLVAYNPRESELVVKGIPQFISVNVDSVFGLLRVVPKLFINDIVNKSVFTLKLVYSNKSISSREIKVRVEETVYEGYNAVRVVIRSLNTTPILIYRDDGVLLKAEGVKMYYSSRQAGMVLIAEDDLVKKLSETTKTSTSPSARLVANATRLLEENTSASGVWLSNLMATAMVAVVVGILAIVLAYKLRRRS